MRGRTLESIPSPAGFPVFRSKSPSPKQRLPTPKNQGNADLNAADHAGFGRPQIGSDWMGGFFFPAENPRK